MPRPFIASSWVFYWFSFNRSYKMQAASYEAATAFIYHAPCGLALKHAKRIKFNHCKMPHVDGRVVFKTSARTYFYVCMFHVLRPTARCHESQRSRTFNSIIDAASMGQNPCALLPFVHRSSPKKCFANLCNMF